jgi:hypothetical protein
MRANRIHYMIPPIDFLSNMVPNNHLCTTNVVHSETGATNLHDTYQNNHIPEILLMRLHVCPPSDKGLAI